MPADGKFIEFALLDERGTPTTLHLPLDQAGASLLYANPRGSWPSSNHGLINQGDPI
jgi:hypothetical protein